MEGRVQLLEKGLFYLSCYLKVGDSNVTGEREHKAGCRWSQLELGE